jgi:omega-6 fatty acid desaturase (delta-12 desaturase)
MSFFILGHDCAHQSFLKNKKTMVLLGHFLFLPTLYPFYAWKYSHNAHHAHANKRCSYYESNIYHDNAWQARSAFSYLRLKKKKPLSAPITHLCRIIIPLGSFLHLVKYHYNPFYFKKGLHRQNVCYSYLFILIFAIVLSSTLIFLTHSMLSLLHFWLMPALLSQVWMSTYTFLHHTSTETKLYAANEWTQAKSINNVINCFLPRWLSFLHFNIDVHIPHHASTKVPCYKLRAANHFLKQSQMKMTEKKFSFSDLFYQIKNCQFWDIKTKSHCSYNSSHENIKI